MKPFLIACKFTPIFPYKQENVRLRNILYEKRKIFVKTPANAGYLAVGVCGRWVVALSLVVALLVQNRALWQHFVLIELEIIPCVVVRYVFNHSAEYFVVIGQQSFLYVGSENIAKQTAEILVARIAQERA